MSLLSAFSPNARKGTGRHLPALVVVGCLVMAMPALQGCVGAAIGAGAAVGVAALQERGVDGKARDIATATEIRSAYLGHDHRLTTAIGIEVYQGRVLLTGAVADDGIRADAVRLAWTVNGVTDVLNEIQDVDGSLLDSAKDSWISTKLVSKMTLDKDILAINYEVETVNGTVYLIGIAQSQEEKDRVVAHARDIDGVRRIINHAIVKPAS